jgi:hypothetical protein
MPSLILKTRLEVLRSNLQDVKDVLALAERRGSDIEKLRNDLFGPDGVRDLAKRLNKRISKAQIEIDDEDVLAAAPSCKNALGELKYALADLHGLNLRLEGCQKNLEVLLGARVELATRRIQERLPDRADASIRDVQTMIDEGKETPGAWERVGSLTAQSEPLFAEYVDLLRGLALRESGIERGICELADRLLHECDRVPGASWKSVAIPSHRGPTALTPAQIIRLGFPEWTIWALPLAAYEFGRIMVEQDKTLSSKVVEEAQASGRSVQLVTETLADAIAMYAVGPAYACSAIFMSLNPGPALPGGPPADGARAEIIFEMLKQADKNAGDAISLAPVLEPLERAWAEAVKETGAVPGGDVGTKERTEFFWRWAKNNYVTAMYSPIAWQNAERLKDAVLKRASGDPLAPQDQTSIDAGVSDVRDMLNAAWLLRLARPEDANRIAADVQALWEQTRLKASSKVAKFKSSGTAAPGVQRAERTT